MEITQPVHRAAQLTPDRPLTVFGPRVRTVKESVDRIARLADVLHSLGVAPGTAVATMSLNSDVFHEFMLGVPWAGGIVVPVNYRWSPKEIAFSLQECGAAILIVDDAFVELAQAVRELCP
jgi:acyl-CoA synthetase (AMP-forming)/AMP-acid ligase II